jgi:glycosyltransferase involved in cell wall biosynthesis
MEIKKQKKIAILTNILPGYRRGFYNNIFANEDFIIKVFAQNEMENIKSDLNHEYNNNVETIKYFDFFKGKFSWQFLPWFDLFKNYDLIIVDGNPRILTHFLIATFFRLSGKRIILYSMLHSYKNNLLNEYIRVLWMRLFKFHLLYNDSEVKKLKQFGFNNQVMIATNNGLCQKSIEISKSKWDYNKLHVWKKRNNIKNQIDILACGRLLKDKYEILIDSIKLIKISYPNILCVIIGDGDGRQCLENRIKSFGLEKNIFLVGKIYEEDILAPYFLSSNIFVHTFAVGLSINHAFGYGLPIITHNDISLHGPEIVLFQENYNGLSYKHKNLDDLVLKIIKLLKDNDKRVSYGRNALNTVSYKYNTDIMSKNFFRLVQLALIDKEL